MSGELILFKYLWSMWEKSEAFVECLECGIVLKFDVTHCAHIIGKGRYVTMRLIADNIMPLCFNCHREYDQGCQSDMMIYYWTSKREEFLLSKYGDIDREFESIDDLLRDLREQIILHTMAYYDMSLSENDIYQLVTAETGFSESDVSTAVQNLSIMDVITFNNGKYTINESSKSNRRV